MFDELVPSIVRLRADVAGVRPTIYDAIYLPYLIVPLLVVPPIPRSSEGLIAECAFEWFYSLVHSKVDGDAAALRKAFAATVDGARELVLGKSTVLCSPVNCKSVLPIEVLSALLAFVGLSCLFRTPSDYKQFKIYIRQ